MPVGGHIDRFADRIAHLRLRLTGPLPGREAMSAAAPSGRPYVTEEEARAMGAAEAAALVLLYPSGAPAETHTVLTVRGADLRHHAGQISFPGGRIDGGETPGEAAVREAWEELSIRGDRLDILGHLTPIYIQPSEFLVHPMIAVADERPEFRLHDFEVAEMIEVPVAHFVGDDNRRAEWWVIRGERRHVPFFAVGRHKVWGATAMMLSELAALWAELLEEEV